MSVQTLEMRVTEARQIVMAEEMLSVGALAERWHCHSNTILLACKRYRESAGRIGLAHVGAGRRLRIPAKAANRYAESADFLRS